LFLSVGSKDLNHQAQKNAIFWQLSRLKTLVVDRKFNEISYKCVKYKKAVNGKLICEKYESYDEIRIRKGHKMIILDERVMSYSIGIGTEINSIIFDTAEKIVQSFFAAGLIQHALKVDFDSASVKSDPEYDGPTILTFDDLSYGFVMWLGACTLSVCAFLYEKIKFRLRNVKKRELNGVLAKTVIQAFL
jgi:hypothetical protein